MCIVLLQKEWEIWKCYLYSSRKKITWSVSTEMKVLGRLMSISICRHFRKFGKSGQEPGAEMMAAALFASSHSASFLTQC